jgi:hypothetical protein
MERPKGRYFQCEPSGIEHASSSNITEELKKLVELGTLDIERPEDSRRIYYVRTNSPLWDIIAAALAAIGAEANTAW